MLAFFQSHLIYAAYHEITSAPEERARWTAARGKLKFIEATYESTPSVAISGEYLARRAATRALSISTHAQAPSELTPLSRSQPPATHQSDHAERDGALHVGVFEEQVRGEEGVAEA